MGADGGIGRAGSCLGASFFAAAGGGASLPQAPSRRLAAESVVTSQNHGFAVDETTLPANVRATHRSLFDGSLQGIELTDRPAFSFQGHPEASPGPREMAYLFDRFITSMQRSSPPRDK